MSNPLPKLTGHKDRRRKKDLKKVEPSEFQEKLVNEFKNLELTPENVNKQLTAAAERLDYERTGEMLLEVLFTGGIIGGGGLYTEDPDKLSPFCIFNVPAQMSEVKKATEVIITLIGRYRYLQAKLKDTVERLLSVLHAFSSENVDKLAMCFAYLFATNKVPMSSLSMLFKDHLTKEGLSLTFVTATFRYSLEEQTIEQLSQNLRKNGLDDKLLDFFPPNGRTSESLARHFSAQGLDDLVKYYTKVLVKVEKDKLMKDIIELVSDEGSPEGIQDLVKQALKQPALSEPDVVPVLWNALLKTVNWSKKSDHRDDQLLKHIKDWGQSFTVCTTTAQGSIMLLNTIQLFCYEDPKSTPIFSKIITLLYNMDVLSEAAIVYWSTKGASPKGKGVFLKQLEPLLKFFEEAEEEDSDDEEEE